MTFLDLWGGRTLTVLEGCSFFLLCLVLVGSSLSTAPKNVFPCSWVQAVALVRHRLEHSCYSSYFLPHPSRLRQVTAFKALNPLSTTVHFSTLAIGICAFWCLSLRHLCHKDQRSAGSSSSRYELPIFVVAPTHAATMPQRLL